MICRNRVSTAIVRACAGPMSWPSVQCENELPEPGAGRHNHDEQPDDPSQGGSAHDEGDVSGRGPERRGEQPGRRATEKPAPTTHASPRLSGARSTRAGMPCP